mgnify:CR=1 FL=1
MRLQGLSIFLPDWLTVWFVVAAVGAFILGFTRAGLALLVLPAIDWIVLPAVEPLIDHLPPWALVLLLIVIGLAILHGVLTAMFGREAVGHASGTYLVRLIDFVVLSPFRVVRWLVALLVRRKP